MELRISASDNSLLEDYFLLPDLLLYRQQEKKSRQQFYVLEGFHLIVS
jgi:hypothetical protein